MNSKIEEEWLFEKSPFEVLWPLEELQSLFDSITPGKLVLIAGRPGTAKGILALQIAAGNARRIPVLYLDTRSNRALMGRTDDWIAQLIADGVDAFAVPNLTLVELEEKVKTYVEMRGPGLVVVNTLQEVIQEGYTNDEDDHPSLGYIVRRIKGLALKLGLVVICVSQVEDEADERPNSKPENYNLLGSIELSHVSDQIYFLWHDRSLMIGQSKNRTAAEQRNTVELVLDQSCWQLKVR